jgi:hypothetical protein
MGVVSIESRLPRMYRKVLSQVMSRHEEATVRIWVLDHRSGTSFKECQKKMAYPKGKGMWDHTFKNMCHVRIPETLENYVVSELRVT